MNRKNSNYSGRQKGRLSKIGIWSKCTSQRSFQAVFHFKSVKYSDQETRSTDERKENRSHRISSRQNNLLTHLLRSGNMKINLLFDQCKRINSNLSQLRSTNFYRFIHWNTLNLGISRLLLLKSTAFRGFCFQKKITQLK